MGLTPIGLHVQMEELPGCAVLNQDAAPSLAAPTCGAWLTMRRTAEYDKRLRLVEEGAQPDQAHAPAQPLPAQVKAQ